MDHARPLKHVPALDGLRGISILAVLLYHAEVPWCPGGFLGVDVFFVLSGYLITSLLRRELQATGHIAFGAFFARRIRRLLPALVSFLLCTLGFVWLFLPEERRLVGADAASALTYTTNLHLVLGARSYFEEALRPSLLKHLWSLAVEEQFYLLFPLLFAGLLTRLSQRAAPSFLFGAAACSALWMGLLYDPRSDASRAYFGTDSHAFGLLIGAGLAFLISPQAPLEQTQRSVAVSRALPSAALLGMGSLVAAFLLFDETESYVFRGGIFAVSIASASIIASIGRGAPRPLAALLCARPLVWLGECSYSVYLWHFPVCVLLGAQLRGVLPNAVVVVLLLAGSVALGALSRQWVELRFLAKAAGTGRGPNRKTALVAYGSVSFAAGALLVWSDVAARDTPETVPELAEALLSDAKTDALNGAPADLPNRAPTDTRNDTSADAPNDAPRARFVAHQGAPSTPRDARTANGDARTLPIATRLPRATSAATEPGDTLTAEALTRRDCTHAQGLRSRGASAPAEVLALGDSVMLGAAHSLWSRSPGLEIDACVGRNAWAASRAVTQRKKTLPLTPTVLVHIGNNGGLNVAQLEELLTALAGARRICLVTARVPRRSQDRTNSSIRRVAESHPEVRIVDWYAASEDHPSWFRSDGFHLSGEGAKAYGTYLVDACL